MANHSSILAWEISWTEEPGGLQSMGCRVTTEHIGSSAVTNVSQCYKLLTIEETEGQEA